MSWVQGTRAAAKVQTCLQPLAHFFLVLSFILYTVHTNTHSNAHVYTRTHIHSRTHTCAERRRRGCCLGHGVFVGNCTAGHKAMPACTDPSLLWAAACAAPGAQKWCDK